MSGQTAAGGGRGAWSPEGGISQGGSPCFPQALGGSEQVNAECPMCKTSGKAGLGPSCLLAEGQRALHRADIGFLASLASAWAEPGAPAAWAGQLGF